MSSAQRAKHERKLRILNYKVGDFGESFSDALGGEMDGIQMNIGIFGITGSGKSALINTIARMLQSSTPAVQQSAGKEGTVLLDRISLTDHITLFDTRGFFDLDKIEEAELFRIIFGLVRPGDELVRGSAGARQAVAAGRAAHRCEKPPIADQIHVVLWVIKANDVRFQSGKYRDRLTFIQDQLRKYSITIITVITFDDEIQKSENPDEERKRVREKALEVTGSKKEFTIANWAGSEAYNETYETRVLEMLECALKCGERKIKVRQNVRETTKKKESSSSRSRRYGTPAENTEEPGDYKPEGNTKSWRKW